MAKWELNDLERRVGRDPNYWQMSPEKQWEDDRKLGILDWDETEKWLEEYNK